MIASLGLVLLSCGWISCWYAGSDTRTGDQANLPQWLQQYGRRIAATGLISQLAFSAYVLGAATGPLLVAVAAMTLGAIFMASVNAWPKLITRCGFLLGAIGTIALGWTQIG
jgi:hypothetical protein